MPEIALRFGVSNGGGLRGATWKLWTVTTGGKFDVYLACRALGSTLKASLHQSGQWHIAYSEETFENQVKGAIPQQDRRFIETWLRPAEIAPGLTLAYLIVTPSAAVTTPIDQSFDKKITWIPNPAEGMATEIAILISKPEVKVEPGDWPAKNSMGTQLIGSFQLMSGETVWAIWRHMKQPEFKTAGPGVGQFYKGKSKEDFEGAELRAIAFAENEGGARVMYDTTVQMGPGADESAAATKEQDHGA
jgi:hypothetical protein